MSNEDILKSLRDQVLDESESLAGLLRKCLALGAVTGSDELRAWAGGELKGYAVDAVVPVYRQLYAPLFVDSTSGLNITRGQQINQLQVPEDLRHHVPEVLFLRQPIEELEQMADTEESSKMTGLGFSIVTALWTQKLGNPFQCIDSLYYKIPASTFVGIIGMVRTALLEIVIDLTKDISLDSLPTRARVDSVVQVHVGSQDNNYTVNVSGSNSGVIGQGDGSTQIQNHSAPDDLAPIIAQLRAALSEVSDPDQKADAEQAIDDFEAEASASEPDAGKVKRRWGILERIATALGVAAVTQAVKDGAPVVLDHLQLLA